MHRFSTCPKRKKFEVSHGKLGDLVSRSISSWLPDGMAELLDDVVGEDLEYVQGRNHLVIIEGFRRPLAKKDSFEHVNSGLADPSLEGSSFLSRVIFIVFVFFLDGRFVRVNAPVTPSLLTSFEGFKLSTRHQPFLQDLRAHSKGISPPSRWCRRISPHCGGSSPVRLDNVCCQSFVRRLSRVNGLCRQLRSGLSNVGLMNRSNMVMGHKSNGRGQGGHLTWLSPPLFMVNYYC